MRDFVKGTLLITSGAFVGAELAAEFGLVPPALLPVGNRRLVAHQRAEVDGCFQRVILSLPASFALSEHDKEVLDKAGIEKVHVPDGLALSNSILHAIVAADIDSGPVAVLHGDTLLRGFDYRSDDVIAVARAGDNYRWAGCIIDDGWVRDVLDLTDEELGHSPVAAGYFNFSDVDAVILALAGSSGDFVLALQHYLGKHPMRALEGDDWLDFGHVHTYYASRSRITTERAFNSLAISQRVVAKRSLHASRIEAEAGWYEKMPSDLRIFLPHYLGRSGAGNSQAYSIEFLYMPSLADLFVFGLLPEIVWYEILKGCGDFLETAARHRPPPNCTLDAMELYLPKTLKRLEQFTENTGFDLDQPWTINGKVVPSLREISTQSAAYITPPEERHLSIVHGDACFSNILYDFRSRSVRLIDPRGQDADGKPTIWGDNRYDLAKLHHSVVGYYDLIVAGYCPVILGAPYSVELRMPSSHTFDGTRAAFHRAIAGPYAVDMPAVEAISLHLFLSMLPLHSDSSERQLALLANALRLYVEITNSRED